MNAYIQFAAMAGLVFASASSSQDSTHKTQSATAPARDDAAAEKLGWRLGTQAWTFRDRSAVEAIETAARLGLKYIELFPGQALARGRADVKVGPEMKDDDRKLLIDSLKKNGVKALSFGVVHPSKDEAATRKFFEFAKALDLENISCEPDEDAFDLVEKLCDEYKINAAVHNHPKPSHYWDPEVVLRNVKKRGARVGACADTGHWPRSGLVPVDCLVQYEGKIIELHFKDITDGVDQPWGTGKGNARAMFAELKRQKFRGLISVEYETGEGVELEKNVAKCIEFFDATARDLSK
ncbi:MAG: sugar phosphate isomerase/epimerase [Planctomycetes bacterium]|nr:sugar phosphate isomerase/epimerase [Planctomycetota bacterium]